MYFTDLAKESKEERKAELNMSKEAATKCKAKEAAERSMKNLARKAYQQAILAKLVKERADHQLTRVQPTKDYQQVN